MKIRIGRREHSLGRLLGVYVLGAGFAIVARVLFLAPWRRPARGRITLLGHSLAGNLEAFARHVEASHPELELLVLIDEPDEYRRLRATSSRTVLSAQRLDHLARVARSESVVSAMGPVFLRYWLSARNRPLFVDVWHGVGFKSRLAGDANLLAYDAHFVSSPFTRAYYEKAGATAIVTGYARTDVTLASAKDATARDRALREFGRPHGDDTPIVLFAPTWKEAGAAPAAAGLYDVPLLTALTGLDALAAREGFLVAYRGHTHSDAATFDALGSVRSLGSDVFPITEELLGAVDVVVTDWSSIATDFLPLGRPVVYLDTTPPAATLAPLDASDRPGAHVHDLDALLAAVGAAVSDPGKALAPFAQQRTATSTKAWGDTLDGGSSERYVTALGSLTKTKVAR